MKIKLEEHEVKKAIIEYLNNNHGILNDFEDVNVDNVDIVARADGYEGENIEVRFFIKALEL